MVRRGLFLDLDGTLADSLPALRSVYRAFLRQFGREGSDTEFDRLNGPPLDVVVGSLARAHGLKDNPAELLASYRALVADACRNAAVMMGAHELLERARTRGWITAVVTSAHHEDTQVWLQRVGLANVISTIVGGDDIARGKPDPAPYLLAVQRTGCVAHESLAIEDSIQGAQAALDAGVPTQLLGSAQDGSIAGSTLYRGRLRRLADCMPRL